MMKQNKDIFRVNLNKRILKYSLLGIIFSNLIVPFSCTVFDSEHCLEDYINKMSDVQSPSLVILNRVESHSQLDCKFKVQIVCSVFRENFINEAILSKSDDIFKLQFINPQTKQFKLFDLSSKIGKEAKIKIESVNKYDNYLKNNLSIILEEKIDRKDLVYKFRIIDFFYYEESWFDIVYFVTDRSGVIGTYFSNIDEFNKETIIEPRGDICEESIDYSNTTSGIFM